jgi:hypothetical protein
MTTRQTAALQAGITVVEGVAGVDLSSVMQVQIQRGLGFKVNLMLCPDNPLVVTIREMLERFDRLPESERKPRIWNR